MMASRLSTSVLVLLCVLGELALAVSSEQADAARTKTVTVPAARPTGGPDVPRDVVGFGFESAFLDDYANAFSENLVDAVARRMGAPPVIRVGGTSGDGCPCGSGARFVLGPSYFRGFERFQNARFTFQIPLGAQPNTTNIREYARRAYHALTPNRTAGIAIGNEVNGYEPHAGDYVADARAAQRVVVNELNLTGPIFEVGDIASASVGKPGAWTLVQAFQQGLDKNKTAKYAAAHWYQQHTSTTLHELMNHTAISDKFASYRDTRAYVRRRTGAAVVLSETGSILADTHGFAPTFGAGLWSVDVQLFGMARGVARIAGSQRPAAAHALWVPVANVTGSRGPTVRAPFYAQPFVADLRGQAPRTGVHDLQLGSSVLAGYSAYEGQKLARLAFVNLREWHHSQGVRPKQTVAVTLPPGITQVKLARLNADAGSMAGGYDFDGQNITYAGEQWSFTVDQGKGHGSRQLETLQVTDNVLRLPVPDSSAVLVYV